MKPWMTPLAVALSLFATTAYAADPNLGRWKLNESGSKIPRGIARNTSVVYETAGDRLKATVDGVDKDGNPTHNQWMGKADSKDYVVLGDPTTDTRALTRVDDLHYTIVSKKDGQVTVTGKISFSRDLKTRTLTLSGKGPDGKPVTGTWVYDRRSLSAKIHRLSEARRRARSVISQHLRDAVESLGAGVHVAEADVEARR